jgi:hypothetical protein
MIEVIRVQCKAFPYITVEGLHERLSAQGLIGNPPLHYITLLRIVKDEELLKFSGQRRDERISLNDKFK